MDYGKMAYLRLDELEKTLERAAKPVTETIDYAAIEFASVLRRGQTQNLVRVEGSGIVTVSGVLFLSVAGSDGYIDIMAGGERISRRKLVHGEGSETIMFPIEVNGGRVLGITYTGSNSVEIKNIELFARGENAALSTLADEIVCDYTDTHAAVLRGGPDGIYFYLGTYPDFTLSGGRLIGRGQGFDVCASDKGGWYIVYRDNHFTLWGLETDLNGVIQSRRVLSTDASEGRVCMYNGAVLTAQKGPNGVFYTMCPDGFNGRGEDIYPVPQIAADEFGFAKGTGKAKGLYYTRNGKSFFRPYVDSDSLKLGLIAQITKTAEAING